ncbi:unnamed protein product, partial [Iphiclides podalirius]
MRQGGCVEAGRRRGQCELPTTRGPDTVTIFPAWRNTKEHRNSFCFDVIWRIQQTMLSHLLWEFNETKLRSTE